MKQMKLQSIQTYTTQSNACTVKKINYDSGMIQVKINEYNVILEIKALRSVQNKTTTSFFAMENIIKKPK